MSNFLNAKPSGTMHQPLGILNNLKNAVLTNNNFVDGSTNTHYYSAGPSGLDILHQHISLYAYHDANIFDKPECSANTRIRILKELEDWMDDPDPEHKIIWLHGPAGAGKSAIAQTTMQTAEKKGCLGASFFFSRGAQGRNNANRLFPTISYQLTCKLQELAQRIDRIVLADRDLPLKSLDKQFGELIDGPLRECGMTAAYPIIGIDGVDECDNELVQAKFLTIICNSVKHRLPLRFFISSRPEPRIKAVFQSFNFLTREIVLDTSDESLDDVSTFLNTGFDELRVRYSHFMVGVPQPWPTRSDLLDLRERSSGHFIYPATVLKFIGQNNQVNPIQQLNIVLRKMPEMTPSQRASPYAELDRLYHYVLAQHPNPSELRRVLMFFVHMRPYPCLLDELLNTPQGTVLGSFSCMHSLIKISELDSIDRPSGFHHASFRDFLLDADRSFDFHIDENKSRKRVGLLCFDALIRCIDKAKLGNQLPNSEDIHALVQWQSSLQYICEYVDSVVGFFSYSRLLIALPSKSVIPSKPMICIFHSLSAIKPHSNDWLPQLSHRLNIIYQKLLLPTTSNLHFLYMSPYFYLLDLSLTLWKPIYGLDPSEFIQEFYYLLEFTPGCIRLQRDFRRYILESVPPDRRREIQAQERIPLIPVIRHLIQTLCQEQDQKKYDAILKCLGNDWKDHFLLENIDDLVFFFADLKARAFRFRKKQMISRELNRILNSAMINAMSFEQNCHADSLYFEAVAKIAKELLFLTTDSPPLIKIHSCFLERPKSASIDKPFSHRSPRLSTDFQYFHWEFKYQLVQFITDRERAGDFYVPIEFIGEDFKKPPSKIWGC